MIKNLYLRAYLNVKNMKFKQFHVKQKQKNLKIK
jgi:hypothetical protein